MFDWDTWCLIACFKELKLSLSMAAQFKCRIYQLDFVGAFLQSQARNRISTILPAEWKEAFPDLAEWFGIPLLLLKSLYGSIDASKNWDDELSDWLTHHAGFERCPGTGSIFIFRDGPRFIYLVNAVDDQLYFSNDNALKLKFEQNLKAKFDIELMGQAHWYLQARLNQHQN